MNNNIVAVFIVALLGFGSSGFIQSGSGTNRCIDDDYKTFMDYMYNPPLDNKPSDSANISSEAPIDPNEIIGLEGYNAPESTDTLRWVSVTQSLVYTSYFENDAELAMAAASKVSITMPLHEKLNYATFGVGSTYSRSSKSSVVASLTCLHGMMLEIPLAHCVRGGMVRGADGRVGKRRAASENVPLPVTSSSPPFFFPFCLQVRNTIPRNVTTLSGISSDWQRTSKKCSQT